MNDDSKLLSIPCFITNLCRLFVFTLKMENVWLGCLDRPMDFLMDLQEECWLMTKLPFRRRAHYFSLHQFESILNLVLVLSLCPVLILALTLILVLVLALFLVLILVLLVVLGLCLGPDPCPDPEPRVIHISYNHIYVLCERLYCRS